ncbi:BHH_G0048390.mRNA.1.CDS.1 [Saccharomyces cerevisiae]|nr:BHH_G0048390.mRNA.1.CDS.1 [Saccharomyces cerevisiae]CAI7329508.1 BHH_G0048390.mRNA.1.CDS.1 [Saccharomyces cerevisiae]
MSQQENGDVATELIENRLSFSRIPRISLHVRDLSIVASKTNTTLVNTFSMDLPSGSVMAVMGGSGSGKTTLLNVLASKISGGLTHNGSIRYVLEDTGSEPNETEPKRAHLDGQDHPIQKHVIMAYLPQQDVLSPRLTCRETLKFAADLKLNSSERTKKLMVEQLIEELGLKDCADTLVGDNSHRGLSGGEKRRLSIGTQMISNPSIMFLDEPTTGLDAYSAFLVIKTLKKLAKEDGRTFIMSIHQPRSDILFLLDQVCILSKGNVVYCDKMDNTIPYFESIGYHVPQLVNPADYFIDLSSVDSRSDKEEAATQSRLNSLIDHWHDYERTHLQLQAESYISNATEIQIQNMTTRLPFWKQVTVLTRRNFKLNFSDYVTLISTFAEPLIIGTVCGWIYYKPDKSSLGGLRTTTACLYASTILQCYLYLLFDTYRLCEQDIALYDRERAEGSVTPLAFIVARKISLFLSDDFAMTMIFVSITYFMFGLEADARKFFYQFAVVFLCQLSCSGLSMLSVAVSRDFSKASLVGNMTFTVLSMGCGFFVNAKVMPVYVRWIKYIAFTWYSFGTLMSSTFTNSYCTTDNLDECLGNQILEVYGFPKNWITVPAVVLLCWSVGYFVVGAIILYLHKIDITLQNEVKSKQKKIKKKSPTGMKPEIQLLDDVYHQKDLEAEKGKNIHITIKLEDIDLRVIFSAPFSNWKEGNFHHETKEILQSVNAIFKPGMINAIMGPSGSGKSSLLNLISGRLKSSVFAKFDTSGSIMFNDIQVSELMFKNVCSYVSQDDDHLLAALTVKETLKYAAALRLHHLTEAERMERTDNLIRSLGLKHCENNIIGNEFVKGISGGEKRRVTMGVQLLNDPPILLLDEPTSGLDSFTSATILEILEKLCREQGKTIIITIHQPRSELFKRFGNVLLLAKSGRTAFNGSPDEMIAYFTELGYNCPSFTNVADFFLDLISVNTQNEQNEISSRARVEKILSAWKANMDNESLSPTPISEKQQYSQESFFTEYSEFVRKPANLVLAYIVNVKRQFTTTRRSFDSLMARIAQIPGLGVIFALFFAPVKHNYTSISNRLGLAQESTALYFVGMLGNLACYPTERDYFYEEYNDNVYGIAPFFLAYMTLELPLSALASVLYAVFTVLACGLPRTAGNFFATVYCSFIVTCCGEALGIMTNTFFERPGFVVNCISIILSIGTQMSGLMSLGMSRVLKGFNYLNPVGYTSMIIINFAFPGNLKLTCEDGGKNPDGTCEFANGHDVLVSYGLVRNTQKYLGIIVCVAIIYRLIAFFILKAKLEWIKW